MKEGEGEDFLYTSKESVVNVTHIHWNHFRSAASLII